MPFAKVNPEKIFDIRKMITREINVKSNIIRDYIPLGSGYIPPQLVGRINEIRDIFYILKPNLKGQAIENAIIYGKSGVGKTAVVRYVIREYMSVTNNLNSEIDNCYIVFINCNETRLPSRILSMIVNTIDPDRNISSSGYSLSRYYEIIWKTIKNNNINNILIVFDEIDKLCNNDILYNLSRAKENMRIDLNVNISIIGITNNMKFKETLEPRTLSSLVATNITFQPYNAWQIRDILNYRTHLALYDTVISDAVIQYISGISAQEHGDARIAIAILRHAAIKAEDLGDSIIEEKHVIIAKNEFYANVVYDNIKGLPLQSRVVIIAIANLCQNGATTYTGEVIEEYNKICLDHDINVMTRSRISQIISELELGGLVDTVVINKSNRGRTKKITMDNPNTIRNISMGDGWCY